MSNTASLRRTDGTFLALSRRTIAAGLAAVMLTAAILSFRPFQPAGAAEQQGGGDIVNQLGYGSLGLLACFCLATFAGRRVLAALLSPSWLLLLGLFTLSVLHATDPAAAMRAALFTLFAMVTIAAVLAIPRDADSFSGALAFAGLIVVGLSYAGLILFPNEALHTADSLEPQHAGFWRGVFSHKNIAGPVMACFSFGGFYLFRRGWRWTGGILFAAALLFLANTGSKTTAGLVPLTAIMVMLPGVVGMRFLTPALFLAAVAGTALATLGIVFIEPVRDLAHSWFPDLTYTGRTALWEFAGEMIAKKPLTGYGYESFWGTEFLATTDQPFDREWDIRGIVHGHNGYLDIAVVMGLPALGIAAVAFILAPARDYMRIPLLKENVFLGDFFMMITTFTALNAFLESFFFRRADPVWLFFVMGVLGLRLVARFPVVAAAR